MSLENVAVPQDGLVRTVRLPVPLEDGVAVVVPNVAVPMGLPVTV